MQTHNNSLLYSILFIVATLLSGCSDADFFSHGALGSGDKIELWCDINQIAATRVNDAGFCNGDKMGVYVVDYEGNTPGTLTAKDNHANNVQFTYDEPNDKWIPSYDVYWTDKHTHIDVYGYYPFASPESTSDYQFEVERNQSTEAIDGKLGGYEASDFLWGSIKNVAPTSESIRLTLNHRMSNARITLIQGSGFADGEWAQTEKIVLATNLVRKASIDLSTGIPKPMGDVATTATIPSQRGDEWRAIVVPQTITAGTTLFSITIGGKPYKFTKNETLEYQSGKMMNFGIKVDKLSDDAKYKLTLVSESITPWENDLVSHDATAKEYLIVHSTKGHLADSIKALGKDLSQITNLKISGEVKYNEFDVFQEMTNLSGLNLKEIRIMSPYDGDEVFADIIPGGFSKTKLTHLILPDRLKVIGSGAFSGCSNLTGSLVIPEGVEEIQYEAFFSCGMLNGTLTLPSTLKSIRSSAFSNCSGLRGNLILPEGLETIDDRAFMDCSGFSGELHLPSSLKNIGKYTFYGCKGFTGSLTIPQSIKQINWQSFRNCGFNGALILHDGITLIEGSAFENCNFQGELLLPKNIQDIGGSAFSYNKFSGKIILPSSLIKLGSIAFSYNPRLSGIVEIPENITSIPEGLFENCSGIEGLVLPSSLETIGKNAFNNCYGIGKIVCKGDLPAYFYGSAFDGVAKDNFALEVPEAAIAQYQTSAGWRDFKRIAAHHELTCSPSKVSALSSEHKQTIIIRAEGEWEVESKPDWCDITPMSGNKKTEATLTINKYGSNSSSRSGKVVFRLKGKDYTCSCDVSQYGYQYSEDQWITLQKATKGTNGGINIVIIGDGFDAKDIAEGTYLTDIKKQVADFFDIEPYKTYQQYFNVYTAIPLSTESGVGGINTIVYNRFGTTFTGGVGLQADYDEIFAYALNAPTVNKNNLNQTLIIVVPNSTEYGGITNMWADGSAISFCPQSTDAYPYDSRGIIQHEAGGHGFGKLADEYIYHNTFIDACQCSCCGHTAEVQAAQQRGWFVNISLTGKMHSVAWSHLIFDSRYSDIVDVFEGAFMHNRGVFRSEQNSCMNNNIPYYNSISREAIVKRIKQYAGESYSFEEFAKNDKREATSQASRATASANYLLNNHSHQYAPRIHSGSPLRMKKVRRHR